MGIKLKILFMTLNREDMVCESNHMLLENGLDKICDVKWAGQGHREYRMESLDETVKRLYGDGSPDWVIMTSFLEERWRGFKPLPADERSYKVGVITADIHTNHITETDAKGYVKALNEASYDALLMYFTKLGHNKWIVRYLEKGRVFTIIKRRLRARMMGGSEYEKIDCDYYLKNIEAPIFHIGVCLDPHDFKPLDGPRVYDASFMGTRERMQYPIRHDIWNKLPVLAEENGWNVLIKDRPPGVLGMRSVSKLIKEGYFVGSKYAEAVAKSKISIFDCSIYKYPLVRFLEGMACKTLVMSDAPYTMERMHFIPEYNFVEINAKNWPMRLKYFIDHTEAREKIAQRGYETFLKYHTVDIRAKEVLEFLEANK